MADSQEEIRFDAAVRHPEWDDNQLDAYQEGYFYSMLDAKAREFNQKIEEQKAQREAKERLR